MASLCSATSQALYNPEDQGPVMVLEAAMEVGRLEVLQSKCVAE